MRTLSSAAVPATTPASAPPPPAPETDPAVVVASPPGAGKTRLVVHLAEQLHRRAGLQVAIAAQTRSQALDLTNRAAGVGAKVALLGARDSRRPPGLAPAAGYLER